MSEATLPLPAQALSVSVSTAAPTQAAQAKTPETGPVDGDFTALLVRELSPDNGQPQGPEIPVVALSPVGRDEGVPLVPDGKGLPLSGGKPLPQAPLPARTVADNSQISATTPAAPELVLRAASAPTLAAPVASNKGTIPDLPPAVTEEVKPAVTSNLLTLVSKPSESVGNRISEMEIGEGAVPKLLLRDGGQVPSLTEAPDLLHPSGTRAIQPPINEVTDRTPTISHRFELPAPIRSHPWNESLGSRIVWMANGHVQRAELHLNPPELGPLEVRVAVSQDETRVFFTAQHAAVREAVDAALPRLRELMGSAGLNLVQVDVSQHDLAKEGQASRSDQGPAELGETLVQDSDVAEAPANATMVHRHNGLIDDYA